MGAGGRGEGGGGGKNKHTVHPSTRTRKRKWEKSRDMPKYGQNMGLTEIGLAETRTPMNIHHPNPNGQT